MMRRSPPVFRSVMLVVVFILSSFSCFLLLTNARLEIRDGRYILTSSLGKRNTNETISGLSADDWLILTDKYSQSGLYNACQESIKNYLTLNENRKLAELYLSCGNNFYNNSMYKEAAEFFIKAEKSGLKDNEKISSLIERSLNNAGLSKTKKSEADKKIIARAGMTTVYQEDLIAEISYRNLKRSQLAPSDEEALIKKIVWKKKLLNKAENLGIKNDLKVQQQSAELQNYFYLFEYLKLNNNSLSLNSDSFDMKTVDLLIDDYAMIQGELSIEYSDE